MANPSSYIHNILSLISAEDVKDYVYARLIEDANTIFSVTPV